MRTNDLWPSPEIITPRNLVAPSLSTAFYFPPSPPYTNPKLKQPVPLPCPVGCGCPSYIQEVDESGCGMALIEEEDHGYSASTASDSSFDLITPPSSPRSRSLELSDESDAFSFESASPLLPTLFDEPSREWDQSSIEVTSPEDGDWDEPLFLNAPTADCESGDLLAALPVNGAPLEDIEHERWLSEQCSQSPLDSSSSDPPLIHPSYFDVFKNEWDAIPAELPESMHNNVPSIDNSGPRQPSIHTSVQNSINPFEHSLFNDGANLFHGPHPSATATHGESIPYGLISPPSPSRRGTLSLPSNEGLALEHRSRSGSSSPPLPSYLQDFSIPALSPHSQLTHSHHMLFDVPSDVFQSPLNPFFDLPHPQPKSLLFAPNAEDVPLPPSPLPEICDLSSSDSESEDLPLALLEETRLRTLRQRYIAKEQVAKARDIALTDYIARLNSMHAPQPSAVYCAVPGGHMPMLLPPSPPHTMEDEEFAGSGPSTLTFEQMRAREIQAATAQRIIERAKRKRAKERVRELSSLLLYKSEHMRMAERSAAPLGDSPKASPTGLSLPSDDFMDEDPPTSSSLLALEIREEKIGHELLHLVAKMIFRRRDSPRSLGGRLPPTSPPRRYVRSSLSREALVEGGKERKECGCCDGGN